MFKHFKRWRRVQSRYAHTHTHQVPITIRGYMFEVPFYNANGLDQRLLRVAHHSPYFLHFSRSILCFPETNNARSFSSSYGMKTRTRQFAFFGAFWGETRNERIRHKTATNIQLKWLNYYAITKATATTSTTVKRNSHAAAAAAIAYTHAVQPQRVEKSHTIHFSFLHKRFFPIASCVYDIGTWVWMVLFFLNFSSTKLTTTIDVI